MICKRHCLPLVFVWNTRQRICIACRNERRWQYYLGNPFPIFGKGKTHHKHVKGEAVAREVSNAE